MSYVTDKVGGKGLRMSQSLLAPPPLKYGRTSCGSSQDRKLETNIGVGGW